ncbi:hypothetical protein FQN57_002670 [Myotisia sp. PD_48]|nr:hypothetical protein FQN57_002670 [Myotisia sp. PD_48]
MDELVRVGNLPCDIFTENSFTTANEYFTDLANQHFLHLQHQRNSAIDDENDCRKKYIAHCLFRKITQEIETDPGPFHLYCDDLRPSNVLVSETDLSINGVIDWEFTYVAPAEFTYAAPWWLLFECPEEWDLDTFMSRYTPRLEVFLKVLRACEQKQMLLKSLESFQCLSDRMACSLESGLFWFCLAARKGYMFDEIYWKFLDNKYFGPFTSLDDRLALLSQSEQEELEGFVQKKMQEATEKTLDEHMPFDKLVDL